MRRRSLGMVALGAAMVLVGVGGCTIDAVRMNQKAQIYYKYGKYGAAEKLLVESLEVDHENAASRYWLGRCYEATDKPQKALYEYGLAVGYDPSLEPAQVALIKLLHRQGRPEEALQAARTYLMYKTMPMREFMRLADTFMAEGLEQEALLACDKAQSVEPTNAQPYLTLAEYYVGQQNQDKAMECLILAFKADPYYPGLGRRLGELGYQVEVPEPQAAPKPSPLEVEMRRLER